MHYWMKNELKDHKFSKMMLTEKELSYIEKHSEIKAWEKK